MNASVIARIAKIVPLAVVAAIGAAACGPVENGSSAAPTPVHSATSVPTAAPTAAASIPSSAPTTAAAATVEAKAATKPVTTPTAKPTAKPAPASAKPASAGGIGIAFTGLGAGEQVQLGDLVPFSVTWTNNDASGTRSVAPVVSTQQYEGAPCTLGLAMAEGTLERRDASGWKVLDSLSQGGGMDYVINRNDGAFTLAAGESRTVEYRMRLSAANRPGKLAIEADAPVPNSADWRGMAKAVVNTAVVDHGGPEVTAVGSGDRRLGTTPAFFRMAVTRPGGVATVRPEVVVSSPDGLQAKDVTVEVLVGGVWKPVEAKDGCNGVTAFAEPGQEVNRWDDSAEYDFRVTLKKDPQHGTKLLVGAESKGHEATLRTVFEPWVG